jgi:threonine dehydrogenase-like Zn-dependent dehydrogenase
LTIKGSFAQIDSFERALNYLDNGRIKVNEIVTQEIPLDWGKALDLAWKRQDIKTALTPCFRPH